MGFPISDGSPMDRGVQADGLTVFSYRRFGDWCIAAWSGYRIGATGLLLIRCGPAREAWEDGRAGLPLAW